MSLLSFTYSTYVLDVTINGENPPMQFIFHPLTGTADLLGMLPVFSSLGWQNSTALGSSHGRRSK
jgi:hypothetical protein